MFFIGSIILTNCYIFFYGIIVKKFFFRNYQISTQEIGIYGSIFVSFLSILINFISPLSPIVCSIILAIPFFFLIKKNFVNKKDIIFILITSIFTIFILAYSNINTPDAGLYHLPYIQTINENKIIIGLSNIHSRFGHVSILQYLSAINFNHLFGVQGILIPSASLMVFCLLYFVSEVFKFINKDKVFNIEIFFSIAVIIYITFKVNRYSGFGNDAVAHLLFFYLISIFFKAKENYTSLYKTSLISVFIFLNKITLGLSFLFPLYVFLKCKERLKIIFSFPLLLLLLWLTKNFLVSGCLIFPVEKTCSKNIYWSNIKLIKEQKILGEAWAKGWPDRDNLEIDQKKFVMGFNWLEAWSKKHLKYILKIIIPYLIFLSLLIISINYFKKEKFKKFKFYKFYKEKIIFLIFILFLSNIIFILKFPLYRYGYSYLISFLIIVFSYFIFRFDTRFLIKLFKNIITICLIIFCTKQLIRINNNYESGSIWPNIYSFLPNQIKEDPLKMNLGNEFSVFIKKK